MRVRRNTDARYSRKLIEPRVNVCCAILALMGGAGVAVNQIANVAVRADLELGVAAPRALAAVMG